MKRDESVDLYRLVSCPRNSRYIAGGQLAVFQGASEAPISESYGSSEQLGKTANWPRPGGCDENGPAAALLVGHVSIQICSLLAPCRRPILIATIYLLFRGQDTRLRNCPKVQYRVTCRFAILGSCTQTRPQAEAPSPSSRTTRATDTPWNGCCVRLDLRRAPLLPRRNSSGALCPSRMRA